ncbi:MAG: hypothetical protein IT233_11875 [Bacteroidia bacterium]|nr:hypothetical protein [Bacteroidia bacterium]
MRDWICAALLLTTALGFGQQSNGTLIVRKSSGTVLTGKIPQEQVRKGIRSERVTSVSDKFELKKMVISQTEFDTSGRPTLSIDFYKNQQTTFQYDSAGRVLSAEVLNTVLNKVIYTQIYTYPEPGIRHYRRVRLNYTKANPKPDTFLLVEQVFDTAGVMIMETKTENGHRERTTFRTDSLGRVAGWMTWIPGVQDSLVCTADVTYGTGRKEIVSLLAGVRKGKKAVLEVKEIYIWNEEGQLLSEERVQDKKPYIQKNYVYNAENRISEMRSFEENTAGVHYSHHIYSYELY